MSVHISNVEEGAAVEVQDEAGGEQFEVEFLEYDHHEAREVLVYDPEEQREYRVKANNVVGASVDGNMLEVDSL